MNNKTMEMNSHPISILNKTLSRTTKNEILLTAMEAMILFFLGVVAMIIHAKLRIPMQLPGRQGLIFIALLMIGRKTSGLRFSGTLFCLGGAVLQLTGAFGFHDPFLPLIYVLLGLWTDVLFRITSGFDKNLLIIAVSGAAIWVMIPLLRLVLAGFGLMEFGSMRFGPFYPMLTHLVFGFAGGILGYSILKIIEKK
jgi:hypothetical protein